MTFFESEGEVQTVMQTHALVAKNLTISRGDTELCSQVNFTILSGQILHIQGPNGIGKSTLLMMLAGLIPLSHLDQTSLMWGDHSPEDWSVLYVGHALGLNSELSIRDNLSFVQGLNSDSDTKLDAALTAVGLSGYEDIAVAKLSSGQKRRVSLARLWLTDDAERLWLLDEPFIALDANMTERLNERLVQQTNAGGRVILTSHQPLSIQTEPLNLEHYALGKEEVSIERASES